MMDLFGNVMPVDGRGKPYELSADGGRTWVGVTWRQVLATARTYRAPTDRVELVEAGGVACLDLDHGRRVYARRRRTQGELDLERRQGSLFGDDGR